MTADHVNSAEATISALRHHAELLRQLGNDEEACSADATAHTMQELVDQIAYLHALLGDLTDDDECDYDHHGGCQTHGFLSLAGERCPMWTAQQIKAANQ